MATESLGRINSILKSSGKRTKELRRNCHGNGCIDGSDIAPKI